RRKTYLQGNQPAAAMAAEQLAVAAHAALLGMREKLGALPGVFGTELLRQQPFDRLPQQLLAGIAEQPLALLVDHGDASRAIDQQDGVGRGLDHQTEALLALPLVLPLACRD